MLSTATEQPAGNEGRLYRHPQGFKCCPEARWAPYSPTIGPELLTKEGTTVQTDGGLAGDLSPIKNCIVELVREGEGLWAAEDHRVSSGSALGQDECWGQPFSKDIARVPMAGPDCPLPVVPRAQIRWCWLLWGTAP